MRLFVVLSPVLSGRKPGDLLTAEQVGGDDDALDRAVTAGYYAEVFFESQHADDADTGGGDHPPRNASRTDWVAYADTQGVEVDDDDSRDDIVELFLGDGE